MQSMIQLSDFSDRDDDDVLDQNGTSIIKKKKNKQQTLKRLLKIFTSSFNTSINFLIKKDVKNIQLGRYDVRSLISNIKLN